VSVFGITNKTQETNTHKKLSTLSHMKQEAKHFNVSTKYKFISWFEYLANAEFKISTKYKLFPLSTSVHAQKFAR